MAQVAYSPYNMGRDAKRYPEPEASQPCQETETEMGGCQNSNPFLGTLNIRCRILMGIQKGTP